MPVFKALKRFYQTLNEACKYIFKKSTCLSHMAKSYSFILGMNMYVLEDIK